MTSKAEMLALVKSKYKDDKALQNLISSIDIAKSEQSTALLGMQMNLEIIENSLKYEQYPTSSDDSIAKRAIEYVAKTAQLNTLFMTLACILESYGEKIEY